jgi:MbtH protein
VFTNGEATMTNPFEDENGEYLVLINEEGQYSLWPSFREVPAGWTSVGPRGQRQECLAYIEANWTDMRPKSLIEQMNRDAEARRAQGEQGPIH